MATKYFSVRDNKTAAEAVTAATEGRLYIASDEQSLVYETKKIQGLTEWQSEYLTNAETAGVAPGDVYTKSQTDAAIKTAVDAAVTAAYKVKGTKATYSELPTTGNVTGDVWNITAAFTVDSKPYPAGTNVVWDGTKWDALGGTVDLSPYSTTANTVKTGAFTTSTSTGTLTLKNASGTTLSTITLTAATTSKAGLMTSAQVSTLGKVATIESDLATAKDNIESLKTADETLTTQIQAVATTASDNQSSIAALKTSAAKIITEGTFFYKGQSGDPDIDSCIAFGNTSNPSATASLFHVKIPSVTTTTEGLMLPAQAKELEDNTSNISALTKRVAALEELLKLS